MTIYGIFIHILWIILLIDQIETVWVLASFWFYFIWMSIALNLPNFSFRSLLAPIKMLPIETKSKLSVLFLWTCNIIKWLRRLSVIVERKYPLTRLRAEKDISLIALVAGITSKSFTNLKTSESRLFC